jgi:hypothetical protein
MIPAVFLEVVAWLPSIVKLVVGTVEGVSTLVKLLQSMGADPEQEAALLVIARQAVEAERQALRAAPRLDPSNPHQILPNP